MANLTPEEIKEQYPVGCVVRLNQANLDKWKPAFAKQVNRRLGEVIVYTYPSVEPIVLFYACGRSSEGRHAFSRPAEDLEKITDETAIQAWRAEVAATAARKASNFAKKSAKLALTTKI